MPDSRRVVATDRGDIGCRLDLVLRRHLTDVHRATRTRIQQWIDDGRVFVNDAPATRPSARLGPGDRLSVVLLEADARRTMTAEPMPLSVLYEDEVLMIVDKPPGIAVHPSYRHASGTLMNALLWHARDWHDGNRPSLVGRLDKQTSGVVVVAKNTRTHAALQRTLSSRDSDKEYLAVVHGRLAAARGAIALRLGHDPRDRRRMVASPADGTAGVASLTRYERLATATVGRDGVSLVRCHLATGRMHQIRVHLATSGWPIVGDSKYGRTARQNPADAPAAAAAVQGFGRHALHANGVTFLHPHTRGRIAVQAPLPDDMLALIVSCFGVRYGRSRPVE